MFHLASPASPRDYERLALETLTAGSLGTLQALRLAEERGARFILASTAEVYGDPVLHPEVERILAEAREDRNERLEQLAERFLRGPVARRR